jgi:hypothetical protein
MKEARETKSPSKTAQWWNGIHTRLKICRPYGLVGSSPTWATTFFYKYLKVILLSTKNKKGKFMGKSYNKSGYSGITTAASEKDDKKIWHGAMRAKNRVEINAALTQEKEVLSFDEREVSDPWSMNKDGKTYWKNNDESEKIKKHRSRRDAKKA